jgi:hypothetical protein
MTSKFVLPKSRVHRITQRRNFHPYKVCFVQEFNAMVCRFQVYEYCKSQKIRVDDVVFSGDTCFYFNGYVNHHKTVSWMQHNPYVAVDTRDQTTVRSATYGNTLLGPDFGSRIEPRKISPVAEWRVGNVSGWIVTHNRYRFYFQQGGQPPHSAGEVQKLLDGLGAGYQLHSHHELKPLRVFLWGHLKSLLLHADHEASYLRHHNSDFRNCATLCAASYQPVRHRVQHHINLCWQQDGHKFHFHLYCFGRMRPDLWLTDIFVHFTYIRI